MNKDKKPLSETHPELAKEAINWDPKLLSSGSHKKVEWKCVKGHVWRAEVKSRALLGRNCPVCSNQKLLIGFNDLKTTHPEIANQASGWSPQKLIGGRKRLEWICSFGHQWKARVDHRIGGSGCPVCSNQKLLIGFNDLKTTHPEIANQASGWDSSKVIAGNDKKFEWKCSKGHLWFASPNKRSSGRGCPSCSQSGFDPNQNSYLYFLLQPIWEVYQIGITNIPDDRLVRHKRNGFDLLELRGPMDGHTAQELETAILRYLKNQKADLSPEHVAGKFDGYSESWTIDSYKVNNLKELIDKASEAGF